MKRTVPNLILLVAALLGAALIGVGCGGGGGGGGGGPETGGQEAANADLLWSVARLKAEIASNGDLIILDCRKRIPDTTGVSGAPLGETYTPYDVKHIAGSYWLDMFIFGDPYPTQPSTQQTQVIEPRLSELGITTSSTICLYDTGIANPQGKVFFQLERQGCTDVHILDGGLPNWEKVGEPVTDVPTPLPPNPPGFVAAIDNTSYAELADFKPIFDEIYNAGPNAGDYTMTDFREGPLYYGHKICPDAIRHGHIPDCGFLCWQDYFDSSTGLLQSPATLEALSTGAGMKRGKTNVII